MSMPLNITAEQNFTHCYSTIFGDEVHSHCVNSDTVKTHQSKQADFFFFFAVSLNFGC